MADPKGLYYGQGNAGLATVLPDSNPAAMAQAVEAQKMKKAALAQKKQEAIDKRREGINKQLSNVDNPGFYFHDKFQDDFKVVMKEVTDLMDAGDMDAAERATVMGVQRLNGFTTAANQKDEDISGARKAILDNDMLTEEGKEQAINELSSQMTDEEGATLHPSKMGDLGVDWTKEGYGKFINESAAIKQALDDVDMQQITETFLESSDNVKNLGNGVMKIEGEEVSTSLALFLKYDKESGEILVKDDQDLVDDGIVDRLMTDPALRRIVDDRVKENNPNIEAKGIDIARAGELRKILESQKGGSKISVKDKSTFRMKPKGDTINIDRGGGKEEKFSASSDKWFRDLSSGQPADMLRAAKYLEGSKDVDGRTIVGARVTKDGFIQFKLKDTKSTTKEIKSETGEKIQNESYDKSKPEGPDNPKYISEIASERRNVSGATNWGTPIDPNTSTFKEALLNRYSNAFSDYNQERHYLGATKPTDLESLGIKSKTTNSKIKTYGAK